MRPGAFIVRAPLLKDFEWNLFMCGTREKRWTKDPFWSGSLWLFMICLLIVLTLCAAGSEERGNNPGISQTRSFSWRKADMSQYHHLVRLLYIFVCSLFWSFWMNVNGSGCASALKRKFSRFNLFCTSMSVTLFRLYLHQGEDSVLHFFFFSELMNLKPFFSVGRSWRRLHH